MRLSFAKGDVCGPYFYLKINAGAYILTDSYTIIFRRRPQENNFREEVFQVVTKDLFSSRGGVNFFKFFEEYTPLNQSSMLHRSNSLIDFFLKILQGAMYLKKNIFLDADF
ncbi:MAG: hypothetical protein GY705_08615 [Bacteroidetes bacterium]|nr:hypothetical protein [Bacteroidota bacterium]